MSAKQNPACQGKDTFERMNFLYQAGALMSPVNSTLSCYYGQLCRAVAKKAVLRMEPAIKRTICKRCGIVLIPGTSSDIEISARNPKLCEIRCRKCGCLRRFMMNGEYKSWLDDPESVRDRLSIDSLKDKFIPAGIVQNAGKRKGGMSTNPQESKTKKKRAEGSMVSETIECVPPDGDSDHKGVS